ALEELAPERIVLLGGTGAVSEAVAETLEDVAAVERTYGTDRYGTAAEVAGDVAPGAPVVYLATGRDFPDALSGSAVAGAQDAPVLLTRPQQLPEDTVAELLR